MLRLSSTASHTLPFSPLPLPHAEGEGFYHLLDAEGDAAMEMKLSATSAASSLALLRFLPSYQNLAWWIAPLTVTRLDQAVRPPLLSETIWKEGEAIWYSRHASSSLLCHAQLSPALLVLWARELCREEDMVLYCVVVWYCVS